MKPTVYVSRKLLKTTNPASKWILFAGFFTAWAVLYYLTIPIVDRLLSAYPPELLWVSAILLPIAGNRLSPDFSRPTTARSAAAWTLYGIAGILVLDLIIKSRIGYPTYGRYH